MERKLYLNRGGAPQERPSYVKILLWAAVGLVVVMLIATRITGIKGSRNGLSKSGQDKGATVVREIPRGTGGMAESGQPVLPLVTEPMERADTKLAPLPGMTSLPETQGKAALSGAEKAAEPQPVPKDPAGTATPSESVASQAFKTMDGAAPPAPAKSTQQAATKSSAPSVPTQGAAKTKPPTTADAASKPPGAVAVTKPKAAGAELYAVQVGSYHEKKNAEDLQRSLKKKGYAVSIKTKPDPKGGTLYVVHLDPVSDMGKAHTLVAQVQNEEKVKPFIMKMQPGE